MCAALSSFAKEQALEVLMREIAVLRHMLTSFRDEHNAIIAADSGMLQSILECRLDLVSSFQKWNHRLMQIIEEIGCAGCTSASTYEEVWTLLEQYASDSEAADLQAVCGQALLLLKEIHARGASNEYLLKQGVQLQPQLQPVVVAAAFKAPVATALAEGFLDRDHYPF